MKFYNTQQVVEALQMLEDPRVQKSAKCIWTFHEDNQDREDIFNSFQQSPRQSWGTQMATSSFLDDFVEKTQLKGQFKDSLSDERDGRRDDAQKSSRNKHNIFGYVANSAIRIVMDKYKLKIMRQGKGNDFTYKEFQHTFGSKGNYMYGPEGFKKLFEGNHKKNMIKLFWRLFEKVLRKDYIIYAVAKGKMKELGSYIETKNRCLLYVRELMEQM